MYYDSSNTARSPGSHRQSQHSQTVQRQHSRQFDGFGQLPGGLYQEDYSRFDQNRFDRPQNGGFSGSYGFDLRTQPGNQTWNGAGAGFGGNNAFNGVGAATGRMKPAMQRPRPTIPNVCFTIGDIQWKNTNSSHRSGLISHKAYRRLIHLEV
jgi:hypothetical protein